jgi:parvulin-like peptidyl-prolyl isomerase
MKSLLKYYALILLLAAIWLGCSKSGDGVVAKIDGEEIKVSVVNKFFENVGTSFDSYEDELKVKRDALDSLIDYKLLVKGAYGAGLDRDDEVEKLVGKEKVNFMFDELYRQEILPSTQVTEKDIDDFYERLKTEYRMAHIMVATKDEADSVVRELKKGTDFGSIARAISLDQSSAVKGGDIGFVSWGGQLPPDFRDAAYALKVGETSEPVKSPSGWHVIKILESRTATVPDKKTYYPVIKQVITSRKSSQIEEQYLAKVEQNAKVEINTDATKMLMDRLNQYYPKQLGSAVRPDNFFPSLDLLKPFERKMVLASYLGGEVSVEDYMNKISEVQEAFRPRFDQTDSLKKVIFQLELKNIMEYEAQQKNVEQSPEFQKRMTEFREGVMADKFEKNVIGQNLNVDEDEIETYYNGHLSEFTTPAQLHVLEIESDSVGLIQYALGQIHDGVDFRALAARYNKSQVIASKQGDIGFIDAIAYPKTLEAAQDLTLNQVSRVFKNEKNLFAIVKLIDIKQAVNRPIDQCVTEIQQKVLTLKRASATSDWLKQERAKRKIEVFADVLEKSIDKSKYEKKG